ncbi:MAG: TolC family protein [Rhodocyclaceae bacterium]|nr:MAG: TolC family protein [Rhodocyclaceae bacterium]
MNSRRLPALALGLVLAGCASFSPDGGFGQVQQIAQDKLGKEVRIARSANDLQPIADKVAALLKAPLTEDNAVQIALLNNRGLQAQFQQLGVSEADLVRAGEWPNPKLSLFNASTTGSNGVREYKIEQVLTFNIFSAFTLPQAVAMESRRFEQTQRAVAEDVLRLAADTRKAWVQAVANNETLRYQRQVLIAAEGGAELAERMARSGNWNKLQQAREQGFYAEAALALAQGELALTSARERLTRLMGLWGEQINYTLPERLPALPATAQDMPDVEKTAMAQRLDLQAVKQETEALAKALGLTKTTRFINVLEFGPARVQEGPRDSAYKTGYEISFELPLFDWGSAKVARAEASYMQAVHRAAETAINARSEVREAYQGYRSRYDIARHYRDEIVPIRKRISDENLLRYNGMLIGVFDLLADARAQVASVNGYIAALRDFWLAQADLDMALLGKPLITATAADSGNAANFATAGDH